MHIDGMEVSYKLHPPDSFIRAKESPVLNVILDLMVNTEIAVGTGI